MDAIGATIGNLHQMLGHAKAATVLGVPPGDPAACLLCAYEADPTPGNRRAAEAALATPREVPAP
jgi:hypothetical protein